YIVFTLVFLFTSETCSCQTRAKYNSIAIVFIYIASFFALSTPAAQDHFSLSTFLLDTDAVTIIALCTIGSDPFLYLETLCVNMFSLCVCICDLCMYVGEVYKCICVCV